MEMYVNKQWSRRLLALLLTVCLVCTLAPAAFAEGGDPFGRRAFGIRHHRRQVCVYTG